MSARLSWAGQGSRHVRRDGAAWTKLREAILRRDGHLGQDCRAEGRVTPAASVHHKVAKAQGGTDDPDNLASLCERRHDKADARNRGHQQRPGFDAQGLPVWE